MNNIPENSAGTTSIIFWIITSQIKIIVYTMDRMANFNISAEEEEMLLGVEDMEEHTNSRPSGSYINTADDPRNYSSSGNFCNRVRIS